MGHLGNGNGNGSGGGTAIATVARGARSVRAAPQPRRQRSRAGARMCISITAGRSIDRRRGGELQRWTPERGGDAAPRQPAHPKPSESASAHSLRRWRWPPAARRGGAGRTILMAGGRCRCGLGRQSDVRAVAPGSPSSGGERLHHVCPQRVERRHLAAARPHAVCGVGFATGLLPGFAAWSVRDARRAWLRRGPPGIERVPTLTHALRRGEGKSGTTAEVATANVCRPSRGCRRSGAPSDVGVCVCASVMLGWQAGAVDAVGAAATWLLYARYGHPEETEATAAARCLARADPSGPKRASHVYIEWRVCGASVPKICESKSVREGKEKKESDARARARRHHVRALPPIAGSARGRARPSTYLSTAPRQNCPLNWPASRPD